MDKGHSPAGSREALQICRALGVEFRPSLLPFTPWGTLHDQLDLLDLVADEDLVDSVDPVQLSIRLLVPEGSLLMARPELREHLRGFDADSFSHLWQHPDPGMDLLREMLASLVAAADAGVAPRDTHMVIRQAAARAAERAACPGRGRPAGCLRAAPPASSGCRPCSYWPMF